MEAPSEPEIAPLALAVTVKEIFEAKDMGRHILSFLSLNDLEYINSSKFEEMPLLNTLSQDQMLWKKQLERHFPERFKALKPREDKTINYQHLHAKWVEEAAVDKHDFKLLLFLKEMIPEDYAEYSNEQIAEVLAAHGFDQKRFISNSFLLYNEVLHAFAATKNQRILDYIFTIFSANPPVGNPHYLTAWHLNLAVACNQSEEIINSLIGSTPIDRQPLSIALKYGYRKLCNNAKLINAYEKGQASDGLQPPMHVICEYGHSDILADYIEKYPLDIYRTGYPTSGYKTSYTPFHNAVEKGQLECLKLLIAAHKRNVSPARINPSLSSNSHEINAAVDHPFLKKTEHGDTLLHLAAKKGFKHIIEELVKENALDFIDINVRNNQGYSALHEAIDTKSQSFIQYFLGLIGLDKTQHIEKTLRHLTFYDENFELFLDFYSIYCKSNPTIEFNNNLMLLAAESNSTRILQTILNSGRIDVNSTWIKREMNGNYLYGPLHHAIENNNELIIRTLVHTPGINMLLGNPPPLELAIETVSTSMFDLILKATLVQLTHPETRNEFFTRQYTKLGEQIINRTLLADAIHSNKITLVNMLLPHTPNATIRSEINNAIQANNLSIFLALLTKILPLDATRIQKKMFFQTEGQLFLGAAALHGSDKIAEWLLDNEAEVDATDDEQRTPLFLAIEGNSMDNYPEYRGGQFKNESTRERRSFLKSSVYSLQSGHIAIISELYARGADFDKTLEDGSNILHHCVQHGRLKTLEFLLELNPNLPLLARRADGHSALSLAMQKTKEFPAKYIAKSLLPKLTKAELRNFDVHAHLLNTADRLWLIKQMHAKFRFNLHVKLQSGDSLMHKAANAHDYLTLKYLLENKGDVHSKNAKGETPLYLALLPAKNWNVRHTVEMLLKAKAGNTVTHDHSTLMHAIAKSGRSDILKLVEEKTKLTVNAEDQQKRTPLFFVKSVSMATELIARGAEVNWVDANKETPLHAAFRTQNTKLIKTLLKNIPASEFAEVINQANNEGVTVLHLAMQQNQLDIATELLANSETNVDAVQHNQQTAMIIAAHHGHWGMVKLLVEKRAAVSAGVLYCAAKAGNAEMVTFLFTPIYASKGRRKQRKIYEGIDPNVLHEGWSALHIAAAHNHAPVVSVLLANGANINLLNQDKVTALYIACQHGHIDTVKLLLAHDANLDIVCNGSLAIQIAATLGHNEIYHLLSKKKLDQISPQEPVIQSKSSSSTAVTSFSFFNAHSNGEAKPDNQTATGSPKKPKTHHSQETQSASSFFTMVDAEDVEMVSEPKQLPVKRSNSETEAESEQPVQPKKAKSETSATEQRRQREREIGGGDRSYLLDPNL
jgi:ankyrin repeat protein